MSLLTREMQDAIRNTDLIPLATASATGIPNVIPVRFVRVESDKELWIVDNFLNKTLLNLKQNPYAALYVYRENGPLCFQVKGDLECYTSGERFQRMKDSVRETQPDLPAKSLIIMRITEIFRCLPGPEAGMGLR